MKFSTRTLKIFAVLFLSTIVWETFNIVGFWGTKQQSGKKPVEKQSKTGITILSAEPVTKKIIKKMLKTKPVEVQEKWN